MPKHQDPTKRPGAPPVNALGIPDELKALRRWVAWQYELRKDRWAKPPIDCRNGRKADVSDPRLGVAFDEALEHYQEYGLAGIGFLFTADAPYSGVDLDDCRAVLL